MPSTGTGRKGRVGWVAAQLCAALALGGCLDNDVGALELGDDAGLDADSGVEKAAKKDIASFSKIIVVGDSLSDTRRMGQGLIPYCPNSRRGYWNNRFSNGYLWIDYLRQDNPDLLGHIANYAVGGAGVLKRYGNGIIGSIGKQAKDAAADIGKTSLSGSMVIVWAGANDIKEATKTGDSVEFGQSIFTKLKTDTIELLAGKGVKHFVLVAVPPIDLVPVAKSWTAGDRGWVSQAVATLNKNLSDYASKKGYVFVPVAGEIRKIFNGETTSVNITDVTNPCWDGPNCVEQGDTPGAYVDQRCTGKMFFDRVHPTTAAHCGIAKWIERAIAEKYLISGGGSSLESCAPRRQTEDATWGTLPRNKSTARAVKYRVSASLNPSATTCKRVCFAASGLELTDRGNVTLTNGTETGYCTCQPFLPAF